MLTSPSYGLVTPQPSHLQVGAAYRNAATTGRTSKLLCRLDSLQQLLEQGALMSHILATPSWAPETSVRRWRAPRPARSRGQHRQHPRTGLDQRTRRLLGFHGPGRDAHRGTGERRHLHGHPVRRSRDVRQRPARLEREDRRRHHQRALRAQRGRRPQGSALLAVRGRGPARCPDREGLQPPFRPDARRRSAGQGKRVGSSSPATPGRPAPRSPSSPARSACRRWNSAGSTKADASSRFPAHWCRRPSPNSPSPDRPHSAFHRRCGRRRRRPAQRLPSPAAPRRPAPGPPPGSPRSSALHR